MTPPVRPAPGALGVLSNRRFLVLWLAQASTQVGGNMVIYGLTILVYGLTHSSAAVSLLILTFLVPAVVCSAVAGVYVDRFDRRLILIGTNLVRGAAFLVMVVLGHQLLFIYLLNIVVATTTTLFAPAEAAMIPHLVRREQLMAANGLFTVTLNASFALGFALLGPLVVNLAGADGLLILVGALYFAAALICLRLPSTRPDAGLSRADAIGGAERAVASTIGQLREGLAYIRGNPSIFWSLTYLAITASLIGVLGVLGPGFATTALGLRETDFVVVVLPLGAGIVIGILLLNVYGAYMPRRRAIEGGLLALAVTLAILSEAGPLSRFLQAHATPTPVVDLGKLVSLLAIVVLLALCAGVAYAFVAIPAQTQLQEELPEDVRGRVFGVLNMLVSIASFLPIVVVGPVADLMGTPAVLLTAAALVAVAGIGSMLAVHPTYAASAAPAGHTAAVDPVAVTSVPLPMDRDGDEARRTGTPRRPRRHRDAPASEAGPEALGRGVDPPAARDDPEPIDAPVGLWALPSPEPMVAPRDAPADPPANPLPATMPAGTSAAPSPVDASPDAPPAGDAPPSR